MSTNPDTRECGQRDLLREAHLSTEEGVYGLILVAGLIAVAGTSGLGPVLTLIFISVTGLVFWAAPVYAGAVAEHSGNVGQGSPSKPRRSLRSTVPAGSSPPRFRPRSYCF